MTVTIWHNPRCSKSRQALELVRGQAVEPLIREYLKQPPSGPEIDRLIDLLDGDAKSLLRDGEPEFKRMGRKKSELSRADIVEAIVRHPILLQRPIVVSGSRAAIGRPPEAVLSVLR
jgi:arsenate reductase